MGYTIGQAATATGKSKGTIYKALKSGRLSGARNEKGHFDIDPAELHRVHLAVSDTVENERGATGDNTNGSSVLGADLKAMREMIDELLCQRDEWMAQAKTYLLQSRIFWRNRHCVWAGQDLLVPARERLIGGFGWK